MGVSSSLMNQGEKASAVNSIRFFPSNIPVYWFFLEGLRLPKYRDMLATVEEVAFSASAVKSMSMALSP